MNLHLQPMNSVRYYAKLVTRRTSRTILSNRLNGAADRHVIRPILYHTNIISRLIMVLTNNLRCHIRTVPLKRISVNINMTRELRSVRTPKGSTTHKLQDNPNTTNVGQRGPDSSRINLAF